MKYKRKHRYLKRGFSVVKYICVYAYAHGLPSGLVPVGGPNNLRNKSAGVQEADREGTSRDWHNKN